VVTTYKEKANIDICINFIVVLLEYINTISQTLYIVKHYT